MVLSGTYFIICVYGTSVTKFNVNCFYLVFITFALPIKNEIYFQKTIIIPVTTGGFELQISNIRSRYLTHQAIKPIGQGDSEYTNSLPYNSSSSPVVTAICDPNKSRARHHRSLKLGSKLKYLKIFLDFFLFLFIKSDSLMYNYHAFFSLESTEKSP